MVNRRNHGLQRMIGLGLLVMLAAGLIVIFRRVPTQVQTGQAEATAVELAQVPTKDLPVPTAMIIGTIYPTETPLPTVPPPPTPTLIPGPSATPMPLPKPADDAAGSIVYVTNKEEIRPGYDTNILVYTIPIDKSGQPQGKPVQLGDEIQVSGFFALHPSPDSRRALITDGWGIRSMLYTESRKVDSPFYENLNPTGLFFDWHPDSRQILMRAEQNYIDIGLWLVDTDTGKHVTLLAQYSSPGALTGGAISPDGQKVIYSLKADWHTPPELWMCNVDGSNRHRFDLSRFDLGSILALSWSPDGSKIAFLGDGLMVMEADGTNLRTLTHNVVGNYDFRPVWSPDSHMLAYVAGEGSGEGKKASNDKIQTDLFANTTIHLVEVITGQEYSLITDGTTGNIDPAWSPDGKQLAFVSKRSGASEVWLANADGSNLRQLTNTNQFIRLSHWGRQP